MTDETAKVVAAFIGMLPAYECDLSINHNQHKTANETAENYINGNASYYSADTFASAEDRAKCIETNELWTVHWYPRTPISFEVVNGSTLAIVMDVIAERHPNTKER